jgi:glycerophosphoryl diester phosphodiesterase
VLEALVVVLLLCMHVNDLLARRLVGGKEAAAGERKKQQKKHNDVQAWFIHRERDEPSLLRYSSEASDERISIQIYHETKSPGKKRGPAVAC